MNDIGKKASCIAVFGTGSDVGKSLLCTALCRLFANEGIRVAPFKAQNMSNNSWVTCDGGEMGRAQVVQAEAARVIPHVDMNPVLLKPSADTGSQIVLQGKVHGTCTSRDYWNGKEFLFAWALESLERLRRGHDLIVIEGAGSCAEINLRDRDFVNFRMAHGAEAPVLLVADIDRGGVFAQIVGTMEVLPDEDRNRIAGIVINKFRGDASLFEDGISYIEEKTGIPVLGLVPWFYDIHIDSEDGVILDEQVTSEQIKCNYPLSLAIFKLPHISNFTDFDVLMRNPAVKCEYLYHPASLGHYDAVILPGTKNVRFDIEWLRDRGWESHIHTYAQSGGMIIGICGGYQMLGTVIDDTLGIEGEPGMTKGIGLLDVETELEPEKVLAQISGTSLVNGQRIEGYEIHMGRTRCGPAAEPAFHITMNNAENTDYTDGASNRNGTVWGTYIHGVFDNPGFRYAFLSNLSERNGKALPEQETETIMTYKDRQYDLLARHFAACLDMSKIWRMTGLGPVDGNEK